VELVGQSINHEICSFHGVPTVPLRVSPFITMFAHTYYREPVKLHGAAACGRDLDCFQLQVPMNYTMLQAYNCDRQKPGEKKAKMPAEKQIYRPDYVKQHFIHYSTITENSEMNRQDVEKAGRVWSSKSPFPDPFSRFGDESTEGKIQCNVLRRVRMHSFLVRY
jgi:hypothetical protein